MHCLFDCCPNLILQLIGVQCIELSTLTTHTALSATWRFGSVPTDRRIGWFIDGQTDSRRRSKEESASLLLSSSLFPTYFSDCFFFITVANIAYLSRFSCLAPPRSMPQQQQNKQHAAKKASSSSSPPPSAAVPILPPPRCKQYLVA